MRSMKYSVLKEKLKLSSTNIILPTDMELQRFIFNIESYLCASVPSPLCTSVVKFGNEHKVLTMLKFFYHRGAQRKGHGGAQQDKSTIFAANYKPSYRSI